MVEAPALPPEVAAVFAGLPQPVRQRLLEVRALVFATAAETPGVGPLTEALRWGEPAYLTAATGSGSTIRLGRPKAAPGMAAVFFNCRTALVGTFRSRFPEAFGTLGDRAILLDPAAPLPAAPLAMCLATALTWHRRGRGEISLG